MVSYLFTTLYGYWSLGHHSRTQQSMRVFGKINYGSIICEKFESRLTFISGRTMLDLACFKGQTECVETLLLQGATILVHDHELRRTPLHAAGKCIYKILVIVVEEKSYWYVGGLNVWINIQHFFIFMHADFKAWQHENRYHT